MEVVEFSKEELSLLEGGYWYWDGEKWIWIEDDLNWKPPLYTNRIMR